MGCDKLAISYKKLWKLMIDHNMNKTQLRKEAGLSTNVLAKLSKNDSVSMDSLMRICRVFHCDVGDIVEIVEESNQLSIAGYSIAGETSHLKVAETANEGYKVGKVK
jgi:DNA-binding Xre family transcriptional regulator